MGCSASEERERKRGRGELEQTLEIGGGMEEIKVFESYKRVTIDETSDGVICQTKEGKTFLPGTLDDYKMVVQSRIWRIFIDSETAAFMRDEIKKSILKKKAEKEEAEKNNKAGAPYDPKKSVVVQNIQKIIDDYQRVVNCIEEAMDKEEVPPEQKQVAMPSAHKGIKQISKSTVANWIKKYSQKRYQDFVKKEKLGLQGDLWVTCKIEKDILKKAQEMGAKRLPDLKAFFIDMWKENEQFGMKIVQRHFPNKVGWFILRVRGNKKKRKSIEPYWGCLSVVAERAVMRLSLVNFMVSRKRLEDVFGKFAKVQKLGFTRCRVLGQGVWIDPKIKFSIIRLAFADCGNNICSNWNETPEHLWDIIEQIGKSDLKNSLKSCHFFNNDKVRMKAKDIKEKFEIYELTSIALMVNREKVMSEDGIKGEVSEEDDGVSGSAESLEGEEGSVEESDDDKQSSESDENSSSEECQSSEY
ncbi:unnamed protein product [Moneuplotes crassus]|uniref:Uncharacterized protein n=1 Tax=Euplotes crassus TaxID=5936 RepID=A0AAD1TZ99_EUPCR|nr:unnamed protein product [Moneuplotes crassus]